MFPEIIIVTEIIWKIARVLEMGKAKEQNYSETYLTTKFTIHIL